MGQCVDKPRPPPASPTHRLHARVRRLEAHVNTLEETLVSKVHPGLEDLMRSGSSMSLLGRDLDPKDTPADLMQRISRLKQRHAHLNTALLTLVYCPDSPEASVVRKAIEDRSLFADP